jgi:hypothetical protein
MKKLLTALGVAALLAAGCASQDRDNGMGGTSDTDVTVSGTTTQTSPATTSQQDTLKTDSINSNGNGGSKNANGGTGGAPAAGDTSTPSNTPPQ